MADLRVSGEGDTFYEIVDNIKRFSVISPICEDCSWLDWFTKIKSELQVFLQAFETTAFQFVLAKDQVNVTKDQVDSYINTSVKCCVCPIDMKTNCSYNEYGTCMSYKYMKGYLISGKKVPSLLKNKFVVGLPKYSYTYKQVNIKL